MERRRAKLDLDDVVYGVHAVEEALAAGEALKRIHVAEERRRDPALRSIFEVARQREIRIRTEPREFFKQFPYKAHQGVVAVGPPFEYVTLEELVSAPRKRPLLLVLLDHVTDPHNAGAIMRTAECAGANGLVMPERRSAGVNATVRKAAAGAAAYLPVARVANIADAIRKLKKANVWVAGADIAPESIDYTKADFRGDAAIVVGAEDKGLSQLVARECDFLVRIPLLGHTESLNASVAAAILLYEAVRQRASESAISV